jgi:hypothetical protein
VREFLCSEHFSIFSKIRHSTFIVFQISQPGPEAISRAKYILKEVKDVPRFVEDLTTSMGKLINSLLLVTQCQKHNENHVTPISNNMSQVIRKNETI